MKKKEAQSSYEAVLAVVLLLLLLYYFFWRNQEMLIAIIVIVLITLLSKTVAEYINRAWEILTKSIGWVMSRLLMSIVFILFLTPIALVYRATKKKKAIDTDSNFVERNYTYTARDIETPW